jgi:hypothetical protein
MLVLGFSFNLSAQNEEELDQVELLKQFIGTWEAEIGMDSVTVIVFTPLNNGLHFVQENKANGETYVTLKGVLGFSDDKQMIYGVATIPDGTLLFDYGRFETKTKYKVDRCFGNTSHAASMVEWEFLTPESFVGRGKWRGDGMTWTPEWNEWNTFKKVK